VQFSSKHLPATFDSCYKGLIEAGKQEFKVTYFFVQPEGSVLFRKKRINIKDHTHKNKQSTFSLFEV
jgi:hypothetical protein